MSSTGEHVCEVVWLIGGGSVRCTEHDYDDPRRTNFANADVVIQQTGGRNAELFPQSGLVLSARTLITNNNTLALVGYLNVQTAFHLSFIWPCLKVHAFFFLSFLY